MQMQLDITARTRLKLDSVQPLIEYLFSLPQESIDRRLSWAEDSHACQILLKLELPAEVSYLQQLVEYYAEERYWENRSLSVWYGIARAVARTIQEAQEERRRGNSPSCACN
jgi:hypothetical protein